MKNESKNQTITIALALAGLVLVSLLSSCPSSTSSDAGDEAPDVLLSGLALSDGTLTPAFSANVTSYTAAVGYAVSSIVVTPTVADADLAVTVDGTKIIPGAGSATISLTAGVPKAVAIAVKYGTVTKTYVVTVTRALPAVVLSGLTPSIGALSPSFGAGITSYSISVAYSDNNIAFTPTVAVSGLTIKVNGTVVASGNQSGQIILNVGSNAIPITVTDGTSTTTYTVTVTRAAALLPKLSSFTLIDDSDETVAFTPPFMQDTTSYTASVANYISSVTVTPNCGEPGVTIKVNGIVVLSGQPSGAISLSTGANTISIALDNGSATNTYTVTVTRLGLPAIQVSGLTDFNDDPGSYAVYVSGTTTINFGSVAGGTNQITITISNIGAANLVLSGTSPYMTIGGTDPDNFTVPTPPSTNTIPPTQDVVAVIRFGHVSGMPATRNATLTIPSNDPDGDFIINLTGFSC